VSGGYVLRSNPAYGAFVQKALAMRPVKLSRAQLETLAIIAYRQPITRPEIDDIRGVDSGQVLKGLADRDLIKMLGKKDEAGRPMLYGTTQTFLELFSLDSLKGLPNLREFTELSEDSREKFAEVTGETIPGPSVASDETGSAGEGTGVSEDGASSTGSSPNEGELDTDLTEGVVPGSNIDDGSVQGADSEAAGDGEAPSQGAFLAEDDSVEQGDYDETEDESDDETEDESDDETEDESDDETEDESDDEVTSGEEAGEDLTADLGASAPEWDDPPEPDFPDDDSR
jgi:segregation and condensation protein B